MSPLADKHASDDSDRITVSQALALGDMQEAMMLDVEEAFRRAAEEAMAEED